MRSNHPKFYHRIVWCVLRLQVSENYDKQLVPPEERHLGRELRSQMVAAEEALLEVCDAIAHTHTLVYLIDNPRGVQVTSHDSLSSHQPVLLRSMNVRNPYVDPLNIIQACALLTVTATGIVHKSFALAQAHVELRLFEANDSRCLL